MAGQETHVRSGQPVYYVDQTSDVLAPFEGQFAWVNSLQAFRFYNGTAWVAIAGGGGGTIALLDEGISVDTALASLNVVGAGARASGPGSGAGTLTIPGTVADIVANRPAATSSTQGELFFATDLGVAYINFFNGAVYAWITLTWTIAESQVTNLVSDLAAKLAIGAAAGGSLTGTYPNPTFAGRDASVDALNKDMLPSGLLAPSVGLAQVNVNPPSGPASGSLTGTYPAPTFAGRDASVDAINKDMLPSGLLAPVPGLTQVNVNPPSGAATGSLTGTYPAPTFAGRDASVDAINKDMLPSGLTGPVTGLGGLLGVAANVQTFTANGTWVAPPGTVAGLVVCIGGGGSGGSGRGAATAAVKAGGGGGAAGGVARIPFLVADTGTSIAVTIGAGGALAAGVVNANGIAGNNGGDSAFGTVGTGGGGGGGAAGALIITNGGGGSGKTTEVGSFIAQSIFGGPLVTSGVGGQGTIGAGGGTLPSGGSVPTGFLPGGGGGAGGVSITAVVENGQAGGTGAQATTTGGTAGSAGGNGGVGGSTTVHGPGAGGGGGASKASGTAGNGGTGGTYGGGGGGGGAVDTAVGTSGAGGAGGPGIVVVVSWR